MVHVVTGQILTGDVAARHGTYEPLDDTARRIAHQDGAEPIGAIGAYSGQLFQLRKIRRDRSIASDLEAHARHEYPIEEPFQDSGKPLGPNWIRQYDRLGSQHSFDVRLYCKPVQLGVDIESALFRSRLDRTPRHKGRNRHSDDPWLSAFG
jgi:hypothetical protein